MNHRVAWILAEVFAGGFMFGALFEMVIYHRRYMRDMETMKALLSGLQRKLTESEILRKIRDDIRRA